jgi:hypothetical protein
MGKLDEEGEELENLKVLGQCLVFLWALTFLLQLWDHLFPTCAKLFCLMLLISKLL